VEEEEEDEDEEIEAMVEGDEVGRGKASFISLEVI
jgi:hypothetical protein